MEWNEELRNIGISTLFVFFGKVLVAAALWYLLALVPLIIIIVIIS
jgi:hypothetical protein